MPSRPPYDPYVIGNLIVSQHIWRLYGTPDASHDSHLPATIIVTPSNVVKGIIGNMDVPTPVPDVIESKIKRICIIGAGPAGLAALKIIADSPQYKAGHWIPTAFEARDQIGGVWLPADPSDASDPPLTPLYDSLTTNLPHPVMAYTSFSFPPSTPIFPRASVVLEYLNDYACHFHLTPHIHLNATVINVHRDSQWKVTISTNTNSTEVLTFDFVIVCNGHYRIPLYPEVPGLTQWLQIGRATHSAYYRRPHNIGNIVLVIGGGPSGLDISSEMRSVAHVIHSVTGGPYEDVGNLKRRGRVVQFHEIVGESENGKGKGQVTFEDGTTESGIDHCILATGYEFSFPFLHNGIICSELPPPVPPLPQDLYYTKYSIFPFAKHIFPLLDSTAAAAEAFPAWSMAFMGRILARLAPFPLLEVQARAILHAFAHPESLDPRKEAVDFMARHEMLRLKLGSDDPPVITKAWHRFEPLEQFAYRDALHVFASSWSNTKVLEWEKEMYVSRGVLREVWVELEKRGETEGWIRGVGEGDREGEEGKREWVEVMRKMLTWAEEGSGLR